MEGRLWIARCGKEEDREGGMRIREGGRGQVERLWSPAKLDFFWKNQSIRAGGGW